MNGLQGFYEQLSMEVTTALAMCRAQPHAKEVHRLRTSTRRIEAVISVARSEHPRVKMALKTMDKVLALLRRIRRAAGEVRDADIQQKIVSVVGATLTREQRGVLQSDLLAEIDDLTKINKRQRQKSKKALLKVLASAEPQLQRRLQACGATIANLRSRKTTPRECAVQWIRANTHGAKVSSKRLHDFRKDTKGARYLAELQPASTLSAVWRNGFTRFTMQLVTGMIMH